MTRIVVLGGDGWFGNKVHQFFGDDSIAIPGSKVRALLSSNSSQKALISLLKETDDTKIINCIGSRYGNLSQMQSANIDVPIKISEIALSLKLYLCHIGSAAEYGVCAMGSRLSESSIASPTTAYGKSKLTGSLKVLENSTSLVLRVFNVVHSNLPATNPLVDIQLKVHSAPLHSEAIKLLNAFTTRDYISLGYTLNTLKFVLSNRTTGILNVCSGTPIQLGDIAREIARRVKCSVIVTSELNDQRDYVVGDSTKLQSVTGLYEEANLSKVVDWLAGH